jgi:hypothetical protein
MNPVALLHFVACFARAVFALNQLCWTAFFTYYGPAIAFVGFNLIVLSGQGSSHSVTLYLPPSSSTCL